MGIIELKASSNELKILNFFFFEDIFNLFEDIVNSFKKIFNFN